jgi:TolB protein
MRFVRLSLILVVAIAVAVLQAAPAREVAHAAFSGGNGKLLVRMPGLQIATVNPDGSEFQQLAAGQNASWSPDGKRIAFDTGFVTGYDILVMDADGSNVTPLITGGTVDLVPTWSPDGDRIVFSSGRGGQGLEVYTARADGTDVVQLTDWDTIRIEGNDPPKWSPDGSKILFIGQEPLSNVRAEANPNGGGGPGTSWDLYTVPAAGGGLTRLTNTEFKEFTPEWSPDGSKIAFGDFSESGIMVMSAGGGGAAKVATMAYALTQGLGPVWSPDGERLAYTDQNVVTGGFTSYVMDSNGGNKTALPVQHHPRLAAGRAAGCVHPRLPRLEHPLRREPGLARRPPGLRCDVAGG